MKKLFIIGALILPAVAGAQWYGLTPGTSGTIQNQQTLGQTFATPAQTNGQVTYFPLEPLAPNSAFGYSGQALSQYLSEAYTIAVTVGALLAVVFLVVGGIRYMTSEVFDNIDKARRQMWHAVWGLIIIIGSFLILYTINPGLLTFSLTIPPTCQPGTTCQGSNYAPITSGLPTGSTGQNLGDPTKNSNLNPYGFSSLSVAQGYAVSQALGCSSYNIACLGAQQYITYDPSQANTSDVQQAIKNYNSNCSGAANVWIGNVKTIDGSVVGAPGQTALVCAGPFQ